MERWVRESAGVLVKMRTWRGPRARGMVEEAKVWVMFWAMIGMDGLDEGW